LIIHFDSEEELVDFAARTARRWRTSERWPLAIGLRGELGSGKTTWARALLRGLGYAGRVPSPTYTLLEHYRVPPLEVVHVDLYRLTDEAELANLGVRDWFAEPNVWLLVEWVSRAAALERRCDLILDFEFAAQTSRRIRFSAASDAGNRAIGDLSEESR
jgi:tRNA threonylcarbamoyladenosine biosynthesis protein TsaE